MANRAPSAGWHGLVVRRWIGFSQPGTMATPAQSSTVPPISKLLIEPIRAQATRKDGSGEVNSDGTGVRRRFRRIGRIVGFGAANLRVRRQRDTDQRTAGQLTHFGDIVVRESRRTSVPAGQSWEELRMRAIEP